MSILRLTASPRERANVYVVTGAALMLVASCTSLLEPVKPPGSALPGGGRPAAATPALKLFPATAIQLTGTVGSPVDPAPIVLVTDSAGTPASGVMLTVEVSSGGGSVSTTNPVTDQDGTASIAWTLGTKPTVNSVAVRAEGAKQLEFTAVARAGPLKYMTVAWGNGQAGRPDAALGERIGVSLQDGFLNPVMGATVTFAVISGGGTIDDTTAVSDASGIAVSGVWTLGPTLGAQELLMRSGAVEAPATAQGVGCSDPIPGSCAAPMELVFSRGDGQLYRMRADGTGLTRLTRDGWNHHAAWSADGRRIAFIHNGASKYALGDVWVMDADGTNALRLTIGAGYGSVAWSPDGSKLAVSAESLYSSTVSIIDLNSVGTDLQVVGGARRPVWSPDGKRIAFIRPSGDDGQETVWVVNSDGTGERQLTPPGRSIWAKLSWSADGSAVVFTDLGRVYSANADGSGSREIVVYQNVDEVDLSRDGKWLLATSFWDPIFTIFAIGYMPVTGGPSTLLMRDAYGASWRP
jgi:hypothetical protein